MSGSGRYNYREFCRKPAVGQTQRKALKTVIERVQRLPLIGEGLSRCLIFQLAKREMIGAIGQRDGEGEAQRFQQLGIGGLDH